MAIRQNKAPEFIYNCVCFSKRYAHPTASHVHHTLSPSHVESYLSPPPLGPPPIPRPRHRWATAQATCACICFVISGCTHVLACCLGNATFWGAWLVHSPGDPLAHTPASSGAKVPGLTCSRTDARPSSTAPVKLPHCTVNCPPSSVGRAQGP